ncbi:MAG: beta-lactamase family protein, partial [Acidobacteriaceae bacterium]|nr:beta-lactamase family protein [Acidobacteriaceae bacterium]
SPQADIRKLLAQFAALLVFVSLLLAGLGMNLGSSHFPARETLLFRWGAEHFLIATTMLVVGLFAILSWNSTFPDSRDVMVLAPLPIRSRTMFCAKIAAVGTSLALTIVALHVLSTLIWPFSLGKPVPETRMPALTSDPAMRPVSLDDLPAVLRRDLPGGNGDITVGVLQHGRRQVLSFGAAKPDSIFQIGSITKTFTALLLARMVEQGRVRLDQPLRELLPEDAVKKPRKLEITLLDLATHHSGLPRMPDDASLDTPYSITQLLEFMHRNGVAKLPDTSFNYSNLGFALLGLALEQRAAEPYADLLWEEVIRPLGLRDTAIVLSSDQEARVVPGYDPKDRPVHNGEFGGFEPAGGIYSTAGDLLTYLDLQLHPDKSPFPAAIRECQNLRADMFGNSKIGLAWMHDGIDGTYSHGGATLDYGAFVTFDPTQDLAIVVLQNRRPVALPFVETMTQHIRERLAGHAAISLAELTVPASGGALSVIRMLGVYWLTLIAAGTFIFSSVLAIQGLGAQFLPRRAFLRVSSFLQLALFALFIAVYLLQPMFADAPALVAAQRSTWLSWSPSYWFLGLMQSLSGAPFFPHLARRACIGLAAALALTAAAYTLSYLRTIRKVVEEPDITPGLGRLNWLPQFGGSLETAVTQFSIRTLLRSRQHRVILAFYIALGLALVVLFFLKTDLGQRQMLAEPNVPFIAASIPLMCAWVAAIRVVFGLPLDLRANWLFRITPLPAGPRLLIARRRAFLVLAVLPVVVLSAATLGAFWPWRLALAHVAVLALIAYTIAEVSLYGAQ